MDIFTIITLCALALAAFALLYAEGLLQSRTSTAVSACAVAAAFLLRAPGMEHETYDYLDFLKVWTDFFRQNGGFTELAKAVGNYNVPYLYFLALFSRSGVRDLFLIKLTSIAFDVLLAWSAMRLVGVLTGSRTKKLAAYLLTLALPTVILNSSYWGQCDSIYASFAVLAVYLALDKKPWASVICAAVSFSFKLQGVFILPLFFILLYTKRIKIRHLFAFPAAYIGMILPAVIAGRPFWDTLTLYLHQAGTAGSGLNYNSPSVFAFATANTDAELWSRLGVAVAFAFCAIVFTWFYFMRVRVSDRSLFGAALLFAVGLPFLLPHMHERYFFIADVLSLTLAVISPVCLPVPLCVSFASLLGYHAYLRMRYLMPMSCGASALIFAIAIIAGFVCLSMCTAAPARSRRNFPAE